MPYILENYVIEIAEKSPKEKKKRKLIITPVSLNANQHQDILKLVFKAHSQHGYDQCWRSIKNAIEDITGLVAGDNKAKDFLSWYLSNATIVKNERKRTIYALPLQIKIEF